MNGIMDEELNEELNENKQCIKLNKTKKVQTLLSLQDKRARVGVFL